ncbi:hypothetical protein AX768_02110 [Burkholderia sp. PAMC 28687]|uniref:hypothetical protein n=1 Tax=Burkholderia sp. PAMC 28687 TaxID=1795874 RepID=UPI0007823D10|nr:hypothetical protein [Burkholderia sp. PAMC 28687]AMM13084.1 hypothetical protein AX768_02110 [Burkholderia sp. PAMC 28687]
MKKLTRISFNSSGWQRPTGEARHQESNSFNKLNGFGFEDWLFRGEWQMDGWRYAFLQGVNKSRRALLKIGEPFDVTAFTIEANKHRRYVATIREAECLDDKQAAGAVDAFRRNGWLDQMKREIEGVNGNVSAFDDNRWAPFIVNVRFRVENVEQYNASAYASGTDPVFKLNRYQLYTLPQEGDEVSRHHRMSRPSPPQTQSYLRRAVGPVICTPEHARMQALLMSELAIEFPSARIVCEENYVDVTVETSEDLIFFEIKSDLAPRTVLRLAVGQLLEYGFYPQKLQRLPTRLVVVGRNSLSASDAAYLHVLRERFALPLEYRVARI